jgi:CheY-like chemotaxis protein
METIGYTERRILVVDDEPLVCDAIRLLLSVDGHMVLTAHNGLEALARLDESRFDLVITDLDMPNMNGDQLAAAVKARAPKMPVLMITAHADMLPIPGRKPAGVDVLLGKPFRLQDLRTAIAEACAGTASQLPGSSPKNP